MVRSGRLIPEGARERENLTQENVAEELRMSPTDRCHDGRPEAHIPDIGMLVELAGDYHAVSIPEIIDGERKSENMDQEKQEKLLWLWRSIAVVN